MARVRLLSGLFLLFSISVFCQITNDKTIYLDSLWNETTQGEHTYYRVIKEYSRQKPYYKVYDFYKSGALQMEGNSLLKDFLVQEGECVYYYENGTKKTVENYQNFMLHGNYSSWYENGNKKIEGQYITDSDEVFTQLKINQFWDKDNRQKVTDGYGDYEIDDQCESVSGKIRNGFREGVWRGTNKIYKYTFVEVYDNGKLISGNSTDAQNADHHYLTVDQSAVPEKGVKSFSKFISKNFKLSNDADRKGGIIVTRVTIGSDGKLIDFKVIKDIGFNSAEEITRLFTKKDLWIPAESRGIKIPVTYSIPIRIFPSR